MLSANAIANHHQKAGKPSQVGRQCKNLYPNEQENFDVFIIIMCGGVDAINDIKLVYNLFFQSIITSGRTNNIWQV